MNCLIVYASMTGNTEEIAEILREGILNEDVNTVVKDILEVDAKELEMYDGILLGAYTWGDGDLPDEFLDFYEDMTSIDLKGKMVAAFGSCDSTYEHRGKAVDILTERLLECGANVIHKGMKVDLTPTAEEQKQCYQFGQFFAEKLKGVKRNEYIGSVVK
jgi:flavodoxin I